MCLNLATSWWCHFGRLCDISEVGFSRRNGSLVVGHEIYTLALLPAPGRCEQAPIATALSCYHLHAFPGLYSLKPQARLKSPSLEMLLARYLVIDMKIITTVYSATGLGQALFWSGIPSLSGMNECFFRSLQKKACNRHVLSMSRDLKQTCKY